MSATTHSRTRHGLLERPDTPAQGYATIAGLFLVALGVLSLVIESLGNWGTVTNINSQPQFLIWSVSGWTTIFWMAMGALALLAAPRLDAARSYAIFAAVVFGVFAVWGFIDGTNVMSIFAADTTNNITHAILAALGFVVAVMPRTAQRPHEQDAARIDHGGRFSRAQEREREREPAGHR